jgi:hypothetical protein
MNFMSLLRTINNESGAVLIIVLLMLSLLTILGISALTNTDIELKISGNDKSAKRTFYLADGGNEIGQDLIQKAADMGGWGGGAGPVVLQKTTITDKNFYMAPTLGGTMPDAANRDVTIDMGTGTTSLVFGAQTVLSSGGAVQMVSGYEGKGKSSAAGGGQVNYHIRSQHDDPTGSTARIHSQYVLLID